jgi:hypothetical protein
MLPVKSNTAEQGCSPVSSNCVVWQGPDLSCINLCNGDTVSDVVYKVAVQLCTIKDELKLSTLDLTCLTTFCSSVGPAPATNTRTLSAVLDFIVKKICCLEDTIPVGGGGGGTNYSEPTLNLPTCLQYTDPNTGQTVTQLIHNQYTLRLGTQFCSLNTTVAGHTTTLASHNTRITTLENAPAVVLPQVTPNCILPAVPTAMNTVLDELEAQYCNLRAVLGTNSQITAGTASQCANLGSANALSQPGTMSALTGWNTTVTTMAQAFQNLWITVCDMRVAVAALKNSVGTIDCTAFVLNYDASTNNDRTEVTLDFNPGTVIPAGFANTVAGSTVVISDGTNQKTFAINLTSLAASGTFTAIVAGGSVSGVALNTSQPYTVTVNGNIIKDGQTCSKSTNKTISVPCPLISNVTASLG